MQCQKCKSENPEGSKFCNSCASPLEIKKTSRGKAIFAVLLFVFAGYLYLSRVPSVQEMASMSKVNSHASPSPVAQPTQPPLELQSFSWSETSSYVTVEGSVKNVSAQPLKNIQVLGIFEAKDGTFITSADALIAYNPILPGQISPFEALTKHNPLMETCRIEFKELMGGKVEHSIKPAPPPKPKKK